MQSTIKWSGTVLTVLLLVVWVWSAWWRAGFDLPPTGGLVVYGGAVMVGWEEPWSIIPGVRSWYPPERSSQPLRWWFDGWSITGGGVTDTGVWIPIWALILPVATPTLWLWLRDRRRQPGLCINCGYDLRGADHAVCPECGAKCERIDRSPAERMSGGSPN